MVGVPGKSKGCRTCRKRKIRCDQEKPECGQCRKGRRECGGYEKRLVWLNRSAHEYRSMLVRKDLDVSQQISGSESGDDRKQGESSTRLSKPPRRANFAPNKTTDTEEENFQSTALSFPEMSRPIGYQHLQPDFAFQRFLSCSLPKNAKQEVPLAWLYSMLDIMNGSSCALPLAAAALGYGWLGHNENKSELVNGARSFYVGALQHLHQALKDEPMLDSDAILATMECLALYEIYEFGTETNNGDGWLAHLSGVETIIRTRGPQMHIAGLGNQMFLFFRTIGIYKALAMKKSTFLSNPEWQHVPWSMRPKNHFHRFLDLAAEVTTLLERAEDLRKWDDKDPYLIDNAHISYVDACAEMIRRSDRWAEEADIRIPAGPSVAGPSTDNTSSSPTDGARILDDVLPILPQPHLNHHNYPSSRPQSLGTPFDVLQSTRLLSSLWTIQLNLYTTIRKYDIFRRKHGDELAAKITLWADFVTQNAWQSFGHVAAGLLVESVREWCAVRKNWF